MRTFYVTMAVSTDDPDVSWWDALGLPDPARWNPPYPDIEPGAVFPSGEGVYVDLVLAVEGEVAK